MYFSEFGTHYLGLGIGWNPAVSHVLFKPHIVRDDLISGVILGWNPAVSHVLFQISQC